MKPNFIKFAKQACDAMLIGQKPNPGIKKARRKYGRFINQILKKRTLRFKSLTKKQQEIVKDLQKFKYGPLIAKIDGKYIVKKTVGESVRIVYTEASNDAVKLTKAIREECWRRGCSVARTPLSDADARRALQVSPKTSLVEGNPLSEAIIKNIDARFFIGYDEDRNWSKGLEKKKLLGAPFSEYIHKIHDRKGIRWCFLGVPVEMKKKDYIIPKKKYDQVFWDSLAFTGSKQMERLNKYYFKALKGADKIRITAKDGTDLTFSVKCRPILRSGGYMTKEEVERGETGLNIPDGEVYCAPLETTANGKILFDKVFPDGVGLIENLWITFKNGKIIDYSADGDGAKKFKKFLDMNTGKKDSIAELGIGTNKKAKYIGAILIDEKIYGTIHIAIGYNQGSYKGKNMASSHLDMIKIMKGKQGNLYTDGKLIMKNGEPAR